MDSSKIVDIASLMSNSGVQFGTSGARGLVHAMTDEVCFSYTSAFLQHLKNSDYSLGTDYSVAIAGDLRSSTARIMTAIAAAVRAQGGQVINCGFIPSPAVTYFALQHNMPSIMVTGSHIPEDRNGIKFNSPVGEITKQDEQGIRKQRVTLPDNTFDDQGGLLSSVSRNALPARSDAAYKLYVERYTSFFPEQCLQGKHLGLYEHSSVGRDIFYDILKSLGASVTRLARSEAFVSVDTEAIRPEDVALAKTWAEEHNFDCIISADGDADRPLVSDENGLWIRGDVAGILTAQYLGANSVATPISSNSAVEKCGAFKHVARTRIGSPYVIAAMQQCADENPVVGYEANGGFLVGSTITQNSGKLTSLPTRDAILVPLALLMLADAKNISLSQLVNTLPARYTTSNRAQNFPTEKSQAIIADLLEATPSEFGAIEQLLSKHFGKVKAINTLDGLRITFTNEEIVHFRPSGNAPEFRCYNEAASHERALEMNTICMQLIESWK